MTRTAISPRLATRTRENISGPPGGILVPPGAAMPPEGSLDSVERDADDRLELEQKLAELDRLGILDVDRADDALDVGLDLVHQLHRLEDAERLTRGDGVALLDERRRAGLRGTVEGADHRRLDPDEAVRFRGDRGECLLGGGRERRRRGLALLGAADGDAHAAVVDRHLADARLLDDADDLADPLGLRAVDAAALERLLGAAAADRTQQRLRLLAEEAEQEQLLLARRQPLGLVAQLVERRHRILDRLRVGPQRDGATHGRVDGAGRRAIAALDQRP